MNRLGKVIWGHIWKHTAGKSRTNATNVSLQLHPDWTGFLWNHLKIHFGEKTHQCNLCGEDTSKTHSGEKLNRCSQCDGASSQAGNLRRHLKTHSGEKPNKCNQCDFAYSRASNLRTHLKMHTGEKSHKCNQCNSLMLPGVMICQGMGFYQKWRLLPWSLQWWFLFFLFSLTNLETKSLLNL